MIFVFDSIPDWYKTQEMCDRVVSEDPFLIVYCLDKCKIQRMFDETVDDFLKVYCPGKYKTQRMCDGAVDDSLAAVKLIPDWFVISKTIKKLYTALYADKNILYFDEDSGNVVFSCNEMGIPGFHPSTFCYYCCSLIPLWVL